ncbi:protein of unknown function [Tenacibaculum maritimum NCIMB 2154]|uniref:Uncharacterized protein n=1 Tax=Tenacibaculum maritimum NCIMB 2154 TaxID=1349785 RepID=A0A2H1EBP8_9FLAO|nr:protein of unknown function [Tenacibaculum maritimum NCIMB 2154]
MQALCPRKALVYGVSFLGIVKINIENLVLQQVFEILEDTFVIGCFWSVTFRKSNKN